MMVVSRVFVFIALELELLNMPQVQKMTKECENDLVYRMSKRIFEEALNQLRRESLKETVA